MKNRYTLLAICLAFTVFPSLAQTIIYGPASEPPGGVFTETNGTPNDNLIGTTEGKIFTFSAIDFLERTEVFYGTVKDSIKLSLDGADFASGDTALAEVLQFSEALSDLSNGSLIWTGITEIPDQPGVPVYTRLVMSFTTDGNLMALDSTELWGLDPYLGAVPKLTPGIMFQVKLQFQASFNQDGSFVPHIQFYDEHSLTDGLAYSSYGWGWYWVNSAPLVEKNVKTTVDEGDTAILRNQNFMVSDVESDASQLVLTVMDPQLPANGTLYLNGVAIATGETFTAEDIENELVKYVHNGSETTTDSIALQLIDSDQAYYTKEGSTTFYINFLVTPVDDSPVVEVNEVLTTMEEAVDTITIEYLHTSDSESADDNIAYTIDPDGDNVWPKNGLVRKSGVPLSSGGTFTQADINAGRITYKHDGTETVTDGFVFSVADEFGHPAENDGGENFFFEISITLQNDLPRLTKNVPTNLIEWEITTITFDQLAATDEESPDSEVNFTLVQEPLPKFGYIEVNGTEISNGGSFTMQDIKDGTVKYVETSNADEPTDAIVFRVTDGDGGMARDGEFTDFMHVFNITQTSARHVTNDQFISFYPNPGNGFFMVSGAEEIRQLSVYNILGREVLHTSGEDILQGSIDLSGEDEGIYMVRITTLEGDRITRRLVIREN